MNLHLIPSQSCDCEKNNAQNEVGKPGVKSSFLTEAGQDEFYWFPLIIKLTLSKARQNANTGCDHRRSNPELAEK